MIRPPDILVGGLNLGFTGIILSFLRPLISELAKRNSTKIGHMLGSKCDLKTHVQNLGCSLPHTNRGGQNHLFQRLRTLTANLTVYIFETKRDIDNRASAPTTTRGLLHRAKCRELWSINGFKLDRHFYQPSAKILRFSLLPGFAHRLQTTELNQTLSHGRG